ncbi:MAG: response regulator [Rhodoferax sp.]|uniref:response regulator n=1 Tax=Rhodoferax sp. TaxID=50421 RepID=UPI002735B0BC|nr:response regulator [Rhodoferax sp.]MDP2680030.1 response regulator [Rhodoferax sp.]
MHSTRDSKSASVAPGTPTAPTLNRVLVVEDNVVQLRLMMFLLKRLGVEVALAQNGQQGFEAILGGEPAPLILMDLHMPRFDGIGATEQIRQWEKKNNVPRRTIVAVTANTYEEDRLRCLNAGMDDVAFKPVSQQSLIKLLTQWLPGYTPPALPDAPASSTL